MSHTARYLLAVAGGYVPDFLGAFRLGAPLVGVHQVIPSDEWTQVSGVAAEVYQDSGHARTIIVQSDRLIMSGPDALLDPPPVLLRPPGGVYPAHGWVPPLQGVWWVQEVPAKTSTLTH